MEFYLDRYDVRRLVEKCQKMDLIELMGMGLHHRTY